MIVNRDPIADCSHAYKRDRRRRESPRLLKTLPILLLLCASFTLSALPPQGPPELQPVDESAGGPAICTSASGCYACGVSGTGRAVCLFVFRESGSCSCSITYQSGGGGEGTCSSSGQCTYPP